MGCDIHVMLERKVPTSSHPEGVWQVANTFTHVPLRALWMIEEQINGDKVLTGNAYWNVEGRKYDFFAALAGVRGDGPDPKGIPEGISPMVEEWIKSWGGDGHSHSWHYADEFAELFMKHHLSDEEVVRITEKRLNGELDSPMWTYIIDRYISGMPHDPGPPEEWRFVYFFDN